VIAHHYNTLAFDSLRRKILIIYGKFCGKPTGLLQLSAVYRSLSKWKKNKPKP
jgi:hypothetical protein